MPAAVPTTRVSLAHATPPVEPNRRVIPRFTPRVLQRLLEPLRGPEPTAVLIRSTARSQWKYLALNLGTNLLQAISEGGTLALIFLAVEALGKAEEISWRTNPLVGRIPALADALQGLPGPVLFLVLLGGAVALQVLQSLAQYLNGLSVGWFAARCRARITSLIHGQILGFSFPCASSYRVGDLLDQAGQGPEAIRIEIETLNGLLLNGLLIAAYLLILVGISPWLLLVAVVMALAVSGLQRSLLPAIRRQAQLVTDSQVAIATRSTEDIQGLRLLHSSGQLDAADQAFQGRMGLLERSLRRQNLLTNVVAPVSNLLPVLALAVVATSAVLLFGARSTGILPSLITFMLALQRLNTRLAGCAGLIGQQAVNNVRLRRLNGLLRRDDKSFRRQGGVPFQGLEREVRFEGVSLRYGPEGAEALRGVDLVLPKGSTAALVGPSGAGKSSIADLLVGLYAPSRGRILVDGRDLQSIDLPSWQQRLGVVSQDTFLFNATLAENIGFGCAWATRADVKAAAARAQAAGFIEELPEGYDTLVGERGYRLSGGQRQRISLARAILRNPELLILDEATSALDSQSERLVQQAIEQFERQRTVLVIAHRLSTIVKADRILVMERGRIVEQGPHAELLRLGGIYAGLWRQQAGGAEAVLRG
ncbi:MULTISPECIES: ABC transporter ATP-binding protein [unclassified Synechococcus]|uniref:ABC transporter ATP-binding protein n=1 Tax=Synechococcales TaxID=1890424 RepID=UPI00210638D4|nr:MULTISPECIES: ABC transporter ATP-binding protein [unclassified Synechococcus]